MDSKASRKRPHSGFEDNGDDDDINRQPPEKRVRFPKKKSKPGDEVPVASANVPEVSEDESEEAKVVAKAKFERRNQNKVGLTIDEKGDLLHVVAHSEMRYKDNEAVEDDGTELMPFNLEEERKEGYFDRTGNYVEYINKDIKDAWLESIADQPILAQKHSVVTNDVVEAADLTSQDIGSIKRRIADALEPGETVLQALRRLKGTSNNRKEKMTAETKAVFDQLTEDAMKLMEDGDYNVYHEKQEVFLREAEGFEKLARARGEGTSSSSGNILPDISGINGVHAADTTSVKEDDDFDMFADNDDETATDSTPNGTGPAQNDYVFDESSGYYYSSSLGYYYDASSGLYCNAASGLWYSYNQETGAYDEIPAGETNTSLME